MAYVSLLLLIIISLSDDVRSDGGDDQYSNYIADHVVVNVTCTSNGNKCTWLNTSVKSRSTTCSSNPYQSSIKKFVKISSATFEYFPHYMFRCIKMATLSLDTPSLRDLEENDFAACTTKHLHIGESALKTLSANVFRQIQRLRNLSIRNSPLETIDENAFAGLVMLKGLMLLNTNVKSLHPKLFSPLKSLQKLKLIRNRLKVLDGGIFTENLKLQNVKLVDKFNHLDAALFSSLKNVTLSLSIPGAAEAEKIVNLTISSTIRKLTFNSEHNCDLHFGSSKMVDLTINSPIRTFRLLRNLTQLRKMDIDCSNGKKNPSITITSTDFMDLTELQEVFIANCNVVGIHCAAFSRNTKLQTLYISNSVASRAIDFGACILGSNASILRYLHIDGIYAVDKRAEFIKIAPNIGL